MIGAIWPAKRQFIFLFGQARRNEILLEFLLNILLAAELSPHRPGSTETMNDVWCRSLSQPMAHLHMLLLVHVPPTTMINTNRSSAAGLSLSSIRQMSQRLRGEGGHPLASYFVKRTNKSQVRLTVRHVCLWVFSCCNRSPRQRQSQQDEEDCY